MKIFYHNDLDGKCSCAIAYRYYKQSGQDVDCISIDYKDDFPFDSIPKNETVIILDFSLQNPGDWERLLEITKSIIWIDHHKTAIEKAPSEVSSLQGKRLVGKAGCVLTWEYYHPRKCEPEIVSMLGDYDVWDFSRYGDDLNIVQCGMKLYDTMPESDTWDFLFESSSFLELIEKGKVALQCMKQHHEEVLSSFGYLAEFEGYKAVCCNVGRAGSVLFESCKSEFDLMMPFYFDGIQYTISIYTKKEIDCSKLASKYGGGGHLKAAGFQCKVIPMKFISKLYPTKVVDT